MLLPKNLKITSKLNSECLNFYRLLLHRFIWLTYYTSIKLYIRHFSQIKVTAKFITWTRLFLKMGVNFLSFNITKLFTASQIKIFSLLLLKGSSKFSKIFVTVTFKAKKLWDNVSQRILCLYNNRAVERSLYNSNAAVESCHPPSISMTKISTNQKNNMRLNWYKLDTHKLFFSILFSNNK